MGPVTFILAVLGCADGAVDCQPVATQPQAYSTMAACEAEIENALIAHSNADFPTLAGECRASKRKAALPKPAANRTATHS